VRVFSDENGERSGVVERVRTHAKESFRGVAAIGLVIGRMLDREDAAREAKAREREQGP